MIVVSVCVPSDTLCLLLLSYYDFSDLGHGVSPLGHSYPFKVRRGGHEEIPHVQDKEQWLRFAGIAVKTYSTSKVRKPH